MMPWYYNVPDWIFTIVNAGLAAWATLLTTKGSLYDLRYKRQWWKLITNRGLNFLGITLLIVGFLIWQKKEEDFQKDKNAKALTSEQQKRDAIITQKVDSNSNTLYDKIAKAFEKRDLKIDTLNGTIASLKDSLKNRQSFPIEDPAISIRQDAISVSEVNDHEIKMAIELTCTNASGKNLRLENFCLIVLKDGSSQILPKDRFISMKSTIAKNDKIGAYMSLIGPIKDFDHIDMAIIGTCQNSITGKTIKIRDVYVYNFQTKKTNIMIDEYAQSFFKRYKL